MVNSCVLVGNLTREVEVRKLDSGTTVCKTGLATNKKFRTKDGEKKEEVQFHDLVIWGKQAEIAEKYLKKGDLLYVEGEISYRNYEKDGVKKYFTEIVVGKFKMLGGKKEGNAQGSGESPSGAAGTPNSGGNEHPAQPVNGFMDENGTPSESSPDDLPF